MIYVNKIENRITIKFKIGYYLELSTPETTKLLGSTKIRITKGEVWFTDPNSKPLELEEKINGTFVINKL